MGRSQKLMKILNIGFGNTVALNQIVSIKGAESAPMKRLIQAARNEGKLIDATYGRKTNTVIITKTHTVLSPVRPETILQRINEGTPSSLEETDG